MINQGTLLSIGNKTEFAIAYRIPDVKHGLGYGKIWIQNKFYGSGHDLIYLKSCLGYTVENIMKAKPVHFSIDVSNPDDLHKRFADISNETSDYLIGSATFTDPFIGYKFRVGEDIVMVWKVTDQEVIFDDLKDYPKTAMFAKANVRTIQEVLDQFYKELKEAINM